MYIYMGVMYKRQTVYIHVLSMQALIVVRLAEVSVDPLIVDSPGEAQRLVLCSSSESKLQRVSDYSHHSRTLQD